MPIYEFYCSDCHTIFSFLSRSPSDRRPSCPRCGRRRLERKVSAFAVSTGRPDPAENDELPEGFDESRMEQVMASMAGDIENINEDDPKQMAGLMRKLFDRTGMPLGAGMDEAMRRMEAGEDPDKIEEEMGEMLEKEDPGLVDGKVGAKLKSLREKLRPPNVDETLYEL